MTITTIINLTIINPHPGCADPLPGEGSLFTFAPGSKKPD
jgi:hypothetical protein